MTPKQRGAAKAKANKPVRVSFDLTREDREMIAHAATLTSKSLHRFIVDAAEERAREVLYHMQSK